METRAASNPQRLPVAVCMIAGAEAGRIRRALESVAGWTGEIIVVLNDDVADGTDKIAESFGAKIFREPWKGHIAQKNSAADKASCEWILGLDADEEVSAALRGEIQELFSAAEKLEPFAAFSFPRCSFYCGRWIRHGDWYPDRQTRLWRLNMAEWGGIDPHDKLLVRGKTRKLHNDLFHHNAESIDHQISKISRYSEDFLREANLRGHKSGWFDIFVRPTWRFARGYFFRLGFLDGWQGWHIAWMTAFYTATRYVKVRAAQKGSTEPD
ncbi:MAG TPA: glycosyltransferase family 2 protein [Candidatus Paceibacterota bacterium]|nr:glycosyltransferase family 2 protein [Candidatus Paceibacterota bacterium]